MSNIEKGCLSLKDKINNTNALAEKVSRKVRELDMAKVSYHPFTIFFKISTSCKLVKLLYFVIFYLCQTGQIPTLILTHKCMLCRRVEVW